MFRHPIPEFGLIADYFAPLSTIPSKAPLKISLNTGDDCAVIEGEASVAMSIDASVEGVHFLSDMKPEDIGWRCLAVSLSDLAAQGATPAAFFLSLSLSPHHASKSWVSKFAKGLTECASQFSIPLIGGDSTKSSTTVISIQVLGALPQGCFGVTRSGAKAGDDIWVSGRMGLADVDAENPFYARPVPRVELGMALRRVASSMLDLSDGLLSDAWHIAISSKVALHFWVSRIPVTEKEESFFASIGRGDDYELLFTASPSEREAIDSFSAAMQGPLFRIGRVEKCLAPEIIWHKTPEESETLIAPSPSAHHF